MEHFRLIGHLDPTAVNSAVREHEAHFEDETWRQSTPGTCHADTRSLYLRMPSEISVHSIFHSLDISDKPLIKLPILQQSLYDVQQLLDRALARVMIVRLKPWGFIKPHTDEGSYADATDRYHWCLTSNPDAFFVSGREMAQMQPGEVWWFDKHVEHAVKNGRSDRDHMIVDVWK